LNSIIQNSSDLKKSLFLEGGGVDKQNDILALREQLKEKEKLIAELSKLKGSASPDESQETQVTVNPLIEQELNKVSNERDALLIKVSDYQKAEQDFANLKKLQEENAELKKKLGISSTTPQAAPPPAEESKILEFEKAQVKEEPAPAKKEEVKTEAAEKPAPAKKEEVKAEAAEKPASAKKEEVKTEAAEKPAPAKKEEEKTEAAEKPAPAKKEEVKTEAAEKTAQTPKEQKTAAAAENAEQIPKEEKSAEELLKEFEKMLG
jgi:hypothetical protein